jgi:outer membrane autotransporter protein
MRKRIAVVAVLGVLVAPAAGADSQSGLSLGLRAAYGVPLGTAGDGSRLNQLTSGAVPVQLDVGWRFDEHWLAGGYFSWGPAMTARSAKRDLAAQGATEIDGHAVQRIGVQGIYTALPNARLAPWVGLGLGYEWTRYAQARLETSTGSADAEIGMGGFEASLQAGADYRLSARWTVGPFASLSFGQYREHVADVDVRTGTVRDPGTTKVSDKGIHEWLQLGVRGTFDL